jgi:hypothetical protein
VPCVDRGIGVLTLADILEGCAEGAVEEAKQAGVLRRTAWILKESTGNAGRSRSPSHQ